MGSPFFTFSPKVCDQTLCAFKFFRHFYFCILIAEVADSQKLFLILFAAQMVLVEIAVLTGF